MSLTVSPGLRASCVRAHSEGLLNFAGAPRLQAGDRLNSTSRRVVVRSRNSLRNRMKKKKHIFFSISNFLQENTIMVFSRTRKYLRSMRQRRSLAVEGSRMRTEINNTRLIFFDYSISVRAKYRRELACAIRQVCVSTQIHYRYIQYSIFNTR